VSLEPRLAKLTDSAAFDHPGGGLATDFTCVPAAQVDEAVDAFERAGFDVERWTRPLSES